MIEEILARLEELVVFQLAEMKDGRAERLRWMMSTVGESRQWPIDKQGRWLGFVASELDGPILTKAGAGFQAINQTSSQISSINPDHAQVLFDAAVKVLTDLSQRFDLPNQQWATGFLNDAWATKDPFRFSLLLGYLQGQAIARGLTCVEVERNRTRSIFHEAYRQCGWDAPHSMSHPDSD